jgi:Holliday junction resolvase RusA-like endonuclease
MTGDIDKLTRSTLDALVQASVLTDDSIVVDLSARKRFATIANPRGAVIRITRIGESNYEPSA